MIYLHEAPYNETLVRHWANECDDTASEEYFTPTYHIKQNETGIVYCDAVDVIPCAYTYAITDEKIEYDEKS